MLLLSFLLYSFLGTSAFAGGWPDISLPVQTKMRSSTKDAALIVSIEDYVFVPDVPGAQLNGRDWFTWFTRSQKMPISRVSLLENTKASRETILDEAKRLSKQVSKGGRMWFVFIGHGAPSKDGRDGLILGVDVQQTASSVYARGVSQAELLRILESSSAPVTAIIDACFSGKNNSGESIAKGLQPLIVTRSRTPRSSVVLTAGKGDEFAGDLPGLGRPAFSYLALGALRGWGDTNQDGYVSGQEVIDYSREAILGVVQERSQTPQGSGRGLAQALSRSAESGPDLITMRLQSSGKASQSPSSSAGNQRESASSSNNSDSTGEDKWNQRHRKEPLKQALRKMEQELVSQPANKELYERIVRGYVLMEKWHATDKRDKMQALEKAIKFGKACLDLNFDYAAAAKKNSKGKELRHIQKPDVPCLYWYSTARQTSSLHQGIRQTVKVTPVTLKAMKKIEELYPSYHYYSVYSYLGEYYATVPGMMGGSTKKSKSYFEKAIINAPAYLSHKSLYASIYAVKTQNSDLFKSTLTSVLQSNPKDFPKDIVPENLQAMERAKETQSNGMKVRNNGWSK